MTPTAENIKPNSSFGLIRTWLGRAQTTTQRNNRS